MTEDNDKIAELLNIMGKANNENMSNTFLLMLKMLEAKQNPDKEDRNDSLRNLLLFTTIMGLENKNRDGNKLQEGFTIAQVLDMVFIQIKEIKKNIKDLSEKVSDIQSKINKMIG